MSGNVYFRHNRYVPVGRIAHDAPDLLLRIKTFMGPARILAAPPRLYLRVSPLAADGGQLGILFNLDAPSGIVGQMPVQDIHFQKPHLVNQPLHLLLSKKMPRFIQHEGAPRKAGIIQHGKRLLRHGPAYRPLVRAIVKKRGRQHLRQALSGVIHPFWCGSLDHDISGRRFQAVRLRSVLFQGSILLYPDSPRSPHPRQGQSCSA